MNLEKHVKTPAEQLADAESSLVPTCARGTHLVDRYIKGRRVDQHNGRSAAGPEVPPFVLRLDQLPATPVSLERIEQRCGQRWHGDYSQLCAWDWEVGASP